MPAKQTLFDAIWENNETRKGPPCTMGTVLRVLEPEDQADLAKAFANPEIKNAAIRKALANRGYKVSDTTIGRHRRKECLCGAS